MATVGSKSGSVRLGWQRLSPEERRDRARGLTEWNSRNAERRRYSLDQAYFDAIDTPGKAYWLGFITGDGCITDDGCLSVNLAAVDVGHLRSLATALGTSAPVKIARNQNKGKVFLRATLHVYSSRMCAALASCGVRPRKSLDCEPWDAPAHLARDYWRGFMDADGTIGIAPAWRVALCGTLPVVEAFGDWVRTVAPRFRAKPVRKGLIWDLGINGRVMGREVVQTLYLPDDVALSRKASRAQALIATGPRYFGSPAWREQMKAVHSTPEMVAIGRQSARKRWSRSGDGGSGQKDHPDGGRTGGAG